MNLQKEWNNLSYKERNAVEQMYSLRYWLTRGFVGFFFLIVLIMGGCPVYSVWEQGLKGEAELARAEQNRQIEVERAAAVKAASADLASAEVIRAQGVKDANDIIAEGLGGSEGYLRYLFINGLNSPDSTCETIYVPTEANLPILESVRAIQ